MHFDRQLLSTRALHATLEAHGLYNSFQFVLRLSPEIHRKLSSAPDSGIVSGENLRFDRAQAFSTYLHETVHWWQHIGSTYGLMLSLSYPAQAHANYTQLKELLGKVGFKKSLRELAASMTLPHVYGTPAALTNIVVNTQFDFAAFRGVTYDIGAAKSIAEDPYFESVGHAHQITYAKNLFVLASTADEHFRSLPDPRKWEAEFTRLSDDVADLFESHSALFVDKEDDDGVFPRLVKGRSLENIQKVFDAFYAANLTYDLAGQWITRSGRFEYDYGWLSQSGDAAEIKAFADRNFEQVFGVWPDAAELLSAG